MQQENRRYLLDQNVKKLFQNMKSKPTAHTIFFTKIKLCKEIRFERTPGHYIKIKRTGVAYPKTITYKNITQKQFSKMQKKREGTIIYKKRYPVHLDRCHGALNLYNKDLKGLYILELPSNCYTKHFDPLQNNRFSTYIIGDITDDPRYDERYLALFGNPSKHPYNIYSIFKDIEHGRQNDPNDIIFDEMKSIDAIRIVLFYCHIEMSRQIAIISTAKDPADALKILNRNLMKSITLLESYEEIFDPVSYQKVVPHLQKLQTIIAPYFDMIMIKKEIEKLYQTMQNPYLLKVVQSAEEKASSEIHRIGRYFKSREHAIIKSQYQLYLKEKSKTEKEYEAQLPLGYTLKVKFHNLYNHILQQADFLDGCDDKKSYETLYTALQDFTLFCALFHKQPVVQKEEHTCKKVEKILKGFEKQQKRNKRLLLLKMLETDLGNHIRKREKKILDLKIKKLLKKEKNFAPLFYRKLQKVKKEPFHL